MFRRLWRLARMAHYPYSAPVRRPLVAVIGATGTGKSELAVELARRFDGEIINGDAMQMYEGLPIITNKLPVEERKGIPHHLLGHIRLGEPTWTVSQFVKEALATIEGIQGRGRMPILVGGTHYYTQSLIFREALTEEDSHSEEKDIAIQSSAKWPILGEPTEKILEKLRDVDPIMADRWHPNDRRHIQRSLEIWLQTGKPASQVYEEQRRRRTTTLPDSAKEIDDQSCLSPRTRLPTLLFWVHAERETLRARLDERVERMMQNGLLDEVSQLYNYCKTRESAGETVDKSRGIWVSIGYKEFEAYQNALHAPDSTDAQLLALKNEALERTQTATRQYSVRQLSWIRIKLFNALAEANALNHLFLLDGSDLARWSTDVVNPAIDITEHFLQGQPLPEPASLNTAAKEMLVAKRNYDHGRTPDAWIRKTCELCNMTAVTANEWEKHIKSRKHRRVLRKSKPEGGYRHTPVVTHKSAITEETVY